MLDFIGEQRTAGPVTASTIRIHGIAAIGAVLGASIGFRFAGTASISSVFWNASGTLLMTVAWSSIIVGISLSVSAGLFILGREVALAGERIVGAARFIPSLAWLPLIVTTYVSSWEGRCAFVVIGVLPHVYSQVQAALLSCPRERLFAAGVKGDPDFKALVSIVLPSALEGIFRAVKFCLALAFILQVVYEFLVTPRVGVGRVVSPMDASSISLFEAICFVIWLFGLGLLLSGLAELLEWRVWAWLWRKTTSRPKTASGTRAAVAGA